VTVAIIRSHSGSCRDGDLSPESVSWASVHADKMLKRGKNNFGFAWPLLQDGCALVGEGVQ
jgi:hypothetical protein